MKNIFRTSFTLTLLFLFGCTANKELQYNYPMSAKSVISESLGIEVPVPKDWFAVMDEDDGFEILLIKNDYSASITVNRISKNVNLKFDSREEELEFFSNFMISSKSAEGFQITEKGIKELNNTGFYSFTSSKNRKKKSVVLVFKQNEILLEAEISTATSVYPESLNSVFYSFIKNIKNF